MICNEQYFYDFSIVTGQFNGLLMAAISSRNNELVLNVLSSPLPRLLTLLNSTTPHYPVIAT